MKRHRNKIVVALAVLAAVMVTGAALAAGALRSPQQESQAIVNDAADDLGVTPAELTNALKAAMKNRVDEAVGAGRLTQAEGAALKARIDAQQVPLLGLGGPGGRHHHHHGGHAELSSAASYLGMTQGNLRTALEGGKTLAQVAREREKSVDGLISAMTTAARKQIEQAVTAGRLTRAQADAMLEGLRRHITAKVNGTFQRPPRGPGPFGQPAPEMSSVS